MTLFIICIKIFFIRILDVALVTIRTIITIQGKTWLASIVGFIEVFIWFVIVKEALNTYENSIIIAISYALGFAMELILVDSYLVRLFILIWLFK